MNRARAGIHLESSPGMPWRFAVGIQESNGDSLSRALTVTVNALPCVKRGHEYQLRSSHHEDWLDFYEHLAHDFGTRLPVSRRDATFPPEVPPWEALATENLSADMHYGYGDPAVIGIGGDGPSGRAPERYCAVVTSNDAPNSFPILESLDLRVWQQSGFVFPSERVPAWAAKGPGADFWAPQLCRLKDEWRVYFAARECDTRQMSIGVARAQAVTGPFVANEEPLLRGNVIDPHVLVEADESAYLFWKADTNDVWPSALADLVQSRSSLVPRLFPDPADQRTVCLIATLKRWADSLTSMERFCVLQPLIEATAADLAAFRARLLAVAGESDAATRRLIEEILATTRTQIRCQRLSEDGLALLGQPTVVLENDQPWEAHVVEGVWVTEYAGCYYMFYVGNDFSTPEYGIGVAVSGSVLGPYRKRAQPLLKSSLHWHGPGHPSLAVGPDGKHRLFFHAFFPGRSGYKEFRSLLCVPIELREGHVVLGPSP